MVGARRSPTKAVVLLAYLIPAAGLVAAFPEHRLLGSALFGLWALAFYGLTLVVIHESPTREGCAPLVHPTLAKFVLAPVAGAIFGLASCYWPARPPDQGQGGWISFSDWPAVVLLLGQHPIATTLFLLILGYTTIGAAFAAAGRRSAQQAREGRAVASLNLVVLLLTIAIYSAVSARRF